MADNEADVAREEAEAVAEQEKAEADSSSAEVKLDSLAIDESKLGLSQLIDPEDSDIQAVTSGDPPYTSAKRFEDLNLSPELLKGLYVEMQFEKPSKIQAISLPMIMTPPYKNLMAQALNGSGITTGFVLGMLSRIDPKIMAPQALCICPTRELAIQNMEVLLRMGKFTGITSELAIPADPSNYVPIQKRPPITAQVIIGTPGTISKWLSAKKLGMSQMKILVFDEADYMLAESGFQDDSVKVMRAIAKANFNCQVLLFSATFNDAVRAFVSKIVEEIFVRDYNQMFKKDRLSVLPETVLCHILSFLPTKDSVATSTLSKEWRNLWTKVPTLDFEDSDSSTFLVPEGGPSLLEVVDRFLQFNLGPMNTFRMWLPYRDTEHITQEIIESWILTAVDRHVKTLYLRLDATDIFLPGRVFTSETLVYLRLYEVDIGTALPSQVKLHCLKNLMLWDVYYGHDETLSRLISGCPVLEKLEFYQTSYGDLKRCSISSPTLKWLESKFGAYDDDYKLEIDTPALFYLKIDGFHPDQHGHSTSSVSTTKLGNVTELKLYATLQLIFKMLENANSLQVLTIRLARQNSPLRFRGPQQIPTCLSSHLRIISIGEFRCIEPQIAMIRYLLKNALVLKKMDIHIHGAASMERKSHAKERILQFERGSEACRIAFFDNQIAFFDNQM